jgi:hypothetical protein
LVRSAGRPTSSSAYCTPDKDASTSITGVHASSTRTTLRARAGGRLARFRAEIPGVDEVVPQRCRERLGLVGHALAVERRDSAFDGRERARDVRVEPARKIVTHDDVATAAALPAPQAHPPAGVALSTPLRRVDEVAAARGADVQARPGPRRLSGERRCMAARMPLVGAEVDDARPQRGEACRDAHLGGGDGRSARDGTTAAQERSNRPAARTRPRRHCSLDSAIVRPITPGNGLPGRYSSMLLIASPLAACADAVSVLLDVTDPQGCALVGRAGGRHADAPGEGAGGAHPSRSGGARHCRPSAWRPRVDPSPATEEHAMIQTQLHRPTASPSGWVTFAARDPGRTPGRLVRSSQ